MRRVILLLVVALIGAGFAGRLIGASAITTNGLQLSSSQLRDQLEVLHSSPVLQCYFGAEFDASPEATSSALGAAFVSRWTSFQVGELTIESYVQRHYRFHPNAADLQQAGNSFRSDLTTAGANEQCTGTVKAALAKAPQWFVHQQIELYADTLELVNHVKSAIPLTTKGLEAVYNADPSAYDTICVTYVGVPDDQSDYATFIKQVKENKTATYLAAEYDGSSNVSCYKPSSSSFRVVREDTQGVKLNQFPTSPQTEEESNDSVYLIFVAPVSYSTNTFAAAEAAVLTDARDENASRADALQKKLLANADVSVASAFGVWDPLTHTLGTIASPKAGDVPNDGAGLSN